MTVLDSGLLFLGHPVYTVSQNANLLCFE